MPARRTDRPTAGYNRQVRRLVRVGLLVWLVLCAPALRAQDDWSLTREPARPDRPAKPRPRPTPGSARTPEGALRPPREPSEAPGPDLSERYVRALLARP